MATQPCLIMSDLSTKLKLSNKGQSMKHSDTITINNVTFPIVFFKDFYFADCVCRVELMGYTKDELRDEMINHICQ